MASANNNNNNNVGGGEKLIQSPEKLPYSTVNWPGEVCALCCSDDFHESWCLFAKSLMEIGQYRDMYCCFETLENFQFECLLGQFDKKRVNGFEEAVVLFGRFAYSYHHHFGYQCRLSDFGFSKLNNLMKAIAIGVVEVGIKLLPLIFVVFKFVENSLN